MDDLLPWKHLTRSETEYSFDEEEADAIVQFAAYHPKDFGLAVIWFSPGEHGGIRRSIAASLPTNARLGSLDRLPVELLRDVLLRLDMHSLFKFRHVNSRSRQTVEALKQYQMVASHGLNLFCALLRTRLAGELSLPEFYDVLCTKACIVCGEFGGFVSLLTWTRCCFKCITVARETQVRTLASARKQFSLTEDELAN